MEQQEVTLDTPAIPSEPPCECQEPGYCPRYGIQQGPYHWGICRGTNCTVEKSERFRKLWRERKEGTTPLPTVPRVLRPQVAASPRIARTPTVKPTPPAAGGVGTELKALLTQLGFEAKKGCQCNKRAKMMDALGIEGCQRERAKILAWLRAEAAKQGWLSRLGAGWKATTQGLILNPLDPASGLLDEAIRRARLREESREWRWVSSADLARDTVLKLLPQLPPQLSGICGVSRSGMIPASILATLLHLPLYAVDQKQGAPVLLSHGRANSVKGRGGPILIVDDTVYSGRAMRMLRGRLGESNYLYAAIYVRPETSGVVDLIGDYLPSPHVLEWNLFNCGVFVGNAFDPSMRDGTAIDFDGIVCHNPTTSEASDPEGYRRWLEQAPPYLLPRRLAVPLVVTARLEKHRDATLDWCARYGVQIGKLVMFPSDDPRERDRADIGAWKGNIYRESGKSLFVESEPGLAERMARVARKPVACPRVGKVYR